MSKHYISAWALVGALLATGPIAQAQVLPYGSTSAQVTTSTFTDLGATGTVITTANTDDANSAAQNIGFTFNYNGTAFTQFVLNTNGLLRLGSAAPSAANMFNTGFETGQATGIDPIGSTSAADINLLMPFNFDLQAGTSAAEYRVTTTGTAPNQVCTIQWKNVSDKAGGAAKQYANLTFQVKLYQTTNVIDFVYGPATGTTGADAARPASIGIKGSGSGGGQDVLANKFSGDAWSTTTFITGQYIDNPYHNFRATVTPASGLTYRFSVCSPLVITSFPYSENFDAIPALQYLEQGYAPFPTSPLSCGASSRDANNDLNSWFVITDDTYATSNSSPNALAYFFNTDGTTAADDWYFTPGLSLRAGYRYQLQFSYLVGSATYPEALEVKYGTAPTPGSQTNTLFSNTNLTNATGYLSTTTANVTAITPTTSGTYYIGFHAISPANTFILLVDDIQVTETRILGVRNAVNGVFTAEASPVPFGETLNLTINTQKPGPAQLTLRDALGRTLRQRTAVVAGSGTITLPELGSLPGGVYFLTVEQGGQSQVLRVSHQ